MRGNNSLVRAVVAAGMVKSAAGGYTTNSLARAGTTYTDASKFWAQPATARSNTVEGVSAVAASLLPGKRPEDTLNLLRETANAETTFGMNASEHAKALGPFQITATALKDTQNTRSHGAKLRKKLEKVNNFIGRDWQTVTVDEVHNNPLYNAIAARLLYSNVPSAIPTNNVGRASYWKKYFNSTADPNGTAAYYAKRNKTLPGSGYLPWLKKRINKGE